MSSSWALKWKLKLMEDKIKAREDKVEIVFDGLWCEG